MNHSQPNLLVKHGGDVLLAQQGLPMTLSADAQAKSNQASIELPQEREDLSVFFSIGMTVNIVMIAAFFIWARKEWKKNNTYKKLLRGKGDLKK